MVNFNKRVLKTLGVSLLVGSIVAPSAFANNANVISPEGSDNPYANMHWAWPTTSTVISDGFGDVGWRYHKGIDIAVTKKPVYASAAGTVIQSGKYSDGTYAITIKHNDLDPDTQKNLISRYLHLEPGTLKYTTNKTVTKGTTIATSGTSGATGYHLHFDVNAEGMTYPGDYDTFDPMLFYPNVTTSVSAALYSTESEEEKTHEHCTHERHDDAEHFFDQLVIDYVGQDKFDKWFNSVDESERTMKNLKKEFKLSDKELNKIFNKQTK